ncbi:MAG: substrate-binding domain-containing protein [Ruminococcus sp.]|nr:substrate-binding domain-containing protein [Ruminococcus sp.]
MDRKKYIGIIMGRIYKKNNRLLLSGILEQMRHLGYSAFIFTLNEECYNDKVRFGERNLFSALSPEQLDGLIFAPYTFSSEYFYEYIEGCLRENFRKPIVRIGAEEESGLSVWYDDRAEITEITLHLIYGHGCRKLLCLTGPDGTRVAHNRAEGFADALRSAGLSAGEDDIIYGDFWIWSAQELAEDIASGRRKAPDGVVCCNDTMAVALCDALAERGISVPEDIIVTGYDGFNESRLHVPAVTTYQTSQETLGRRAMCRLFEAMTGRTSEPLCTERGVLLRRESCGCNSNSETISAKDLGIIADEGILDCTVSASFYEAATLNDFTMRMFEMQYKFMDSSRFGTERLFLCLCDDWDAVMQTSSGREYRTEGYSDMMYLIGSEGSRMTFPLSEILPAAIDKEAPTSAFILPVHFQDQCFGYIALEVNDVADDFNLEFIRYCREVNNALKFLCTQNELKRLLYRRKLVQSRDELTGLYIFEQSGDMWDELCKSAADNGELLYIVAISAGGLRNIENDSGYVESDKYLAAFADVLSKSCTSREKLFKFGEKSFVMTGSGRSPEKRPEAYLKEVEESIWRSNFYTDERYMVYARSDTKILPAGEKLSAEAASDMIGRMISGLAGSLNNQLSEHLHYSELIELRKEIFLHPETDWNGEMCCERLNISKSYFHKIYTKLFGVSFMQDLQKSRLNCAKKLLVTTSMLLPDIAEKCGYDYYNFMRVFKKETGMTPTQYRKSRNLN